MLRGRQDPDQLPKLDNKTEWTLFNSSVEPPPKKNFIIPIYFNRSCLATTIIPLVLQ
jgi:hypothetical protein